MRCAINCKFRRLAPHSSQLRPSKHVLLFVLGVILVFFLDPIRLQPEYVRAATVTPGVSGPNQNVPSQTKNNTGYIPQQRVFPHPIDRGVPARRRDDIDSEKPSPESIYDGAEENGALIDPDEETRTQPRDKVHKRVSQTLAAKMVPPRIPYLSELALVIDDRIRELAKLEPLEAEKRFQKELEIAQASEERLKEKELLTHLGHLYYLTGQFQKATDMLEKALSTTRVVGSVQEEAALLRDIAAAYTGWGEYEKAMDLNVLALRLSTGSADIKTTQMIRNNMGVLEKNRGEYEAARQRFDEALKNRPKDGWVTFLVFRNLGDLCRRWCVFGCAQESYEGMLESAQSLYDPKRAAEAHLKLAQLFSKRNLHEKSLEQIQKALSLLEMSGEPIDLASKLMGDAYLELGMTDKAEPYLKQAGYASSLGRLKLLQSQPQQAEKHYLKLLSAAEQTGNLNALFTAHTGLGMVAEVLGDHTRSVNHYSKALAVLEQVRSSLLPSERKNFFAVRVNGFRRSTPGKRLVKIAIMTDRPEESIYPSEATRQRSFADNLSSRGKGAYFGVPRSVLIEEDQLTVKQASLRTALNVLPEHIHPERYRDLNKQIQETQSAYTKFVNRLYRDYKHYASVKYPKPVILEAALIKPDEYVLIIDQVEDGIALRLLKGNRVLAASLVQWRLKEQIEAVNTFRKPFETCRLRSFECELAERLYRKLLSDMFKQIPQGNHIIIIPDGIWALVPFEALVVKGKPKWKKDKRGPFPDGLTYVGDLWDISYYQSLTALTLVRELKAHIEPGSRLLVMADPVFSTQDARAKSKRFLAGRSVSRQYVLMEAAAATVKSSGFVPLKRLHETGVLAKSLKDLFGQSCDAFTGFDCTKKIFVDQITPKLNHYKYLVFATHGFASNSIPGIMEPVLWLSTIPKGSGASLTMSEVAGLSINADIAALTACQTGLGQVLAGEGVMSMGRAFQCAGAKSVLMSLWGVYEPSSVTLTEEIFRGLQKGNSKREALKAARNRIRHEGYQHPFYWSAFILVGETD